MDETVLNLEKAAMERWRNGDPMGFLELSADDICYTDPGQTKPIIGIDAYRQFMQSLVGQVHYQRSEFIEPKVVLIGDAALLSYNYRSSVLDPQGVVLSQTPWNSTEVYFKRHGEWKIVHNHWSFLQHRLPTAVEVPLPVKSGEIKYDGILAELMRLETVAMDRWRKGDVYGFLELSDPDVTYFDTGTRQRINGLEALTAEYQPRHGKIFYDVMDFIEPWVIVNGDMAVLFYRFLSTHLNADGTIRSRTPWNCTEVFVRRQGAWKTIHTHWSFIRGER